MPAQLSQTTQLVALLKACSPEDLQALLKISPSLATLNHERFQAYDEQLLAPPHAAQAMMAYRGEVYQQLGADDFTVEQWQFAQQHVGIVSAFYGLLRPLDWILPYRLEMATQPADHWPFKRMVDFWQGQIHELINTRCQQSPVVNLCSNEYARAAQVERWSSTEVLSIGFRQHRQGQLKNIALLAKKARGQMLRYIISNQLTEIEDLKHFAVDGYAFSAELSSPGQWIFCC